MQTPNTDTSRFLESLGFSVWVDKQPKKDPTIEVRASLNQVSTWLRDGMDRDYPEQGSQAPKYFVRDREGDKWTGGSYEDLCNALNGDLNLQPFFAAKNKLMSSGLLSKVQTAIATNIPKRRRVFTEYDGEWSYERVGHEKPWETVAKRPGAVRTLDLICNAAFSAGSNASEIDQYGCLAWALSQVLESAGIAVRVILAYRLDHITASTNHGMNLEIEVKKSGEYLAPPRLAATFKSLFFRRAVFGLLSAGCDAIGQRSSHTLGRPAYKNAAIAFSDGRLEIQPESLRASEEAILGALAQAIGLVLPGAGAA